MKRLISAYLVLLAIAAFVGCAEDDPVVPPPPGSNGTPFADLTERDHVLVNLELAYNRRNINEYQKLLDVNFVFFFSDGDVSGGSVPESWLYDDEVNATRNMFDRNYSGPNPIQSISLTMNLKSIQWVAVTSDDPAYPSETWYQTVVSYDYTIQAAPDITFVVTSNPKVQFFVREFEDDGDTQWRLVRWRDLSDSRRTSAISAFSTEEHSWGAVKSLYR